MLYYMFCLFDQSKLPELPKSAYLTSSRQSVYTNNVQHGTNTMPDQVIHEMLQTAHTTQRDSAHLGATVTRT